MKILQLTGIRTLTLGEVPDPVIDDDTHVRIRMASVGVCGSDVHYYHTGRIGSQVAHFPFTLGHEGAGVVDAVGAGVTRVAVGDRIAVEPALSCGRCDQCRAGRGHTCRSIRFLACPGQLEGCLKELMVMPEDNCIPIDDAMSFDRAAFAEPLSIGVYAVKRSPAVERAAVGVLGCGPIGFSTLLAARAAGAHAIYATDKLPYRVELARRLGAAWAGNPDTDRVAEEVCDREPLGLDTVFECCGDQAALDQAVELLKPGGTLVIVGIPLVDRVSFDIDRLRLKEIDIRNIRRQVNCTGTALSMIASGAADVDPLITHRFSLERAGDAFELVSRYGDGVVKAVIHMG